MINNNLLRTKTSDGTFLTNVPRLLKGYFLGAFVKLRRAIVSFVMLVSPSSCNNSALTGRIFMKSGISEFSENLLRKFQFH